MSVTANVVDYAEESSHASPTGGSSEESRIVNVMVVGTFDRDEAIREAHWRTWQDAEGDILSGPDLVTVQGPGDGLDTECWLVSHRITFLRYW